MARLQFFCPRWGSDAIDWNEFCARVAAAGYDGVEAPLPDDAHTLRQMQDAIRRHHLLFIGQYWQTFEQDPDDQRAAFEKRLYQLATLQPVKVNAQTGRDYFSFDQNRKLFDTASAFTGVTQIPVAHETHRNKALFAAHIAKNYLERIPGLSITADLSHWCNVAESFLEDQPGAVDLALRRTIHIHARVGHPQGAQVADPRLPEWQTALGHHLGWWKRIIRYQQESGANAITITTEFGPPPYMPVKSATLEPLASQWDINCWMMERIREAISGE